LFKHSQAHFQKKRKSALLPENRLRFEVANKTPPDIHVKIKWHKDFRKFIHEQKFRNFIP